MNSTVTQQAEPTFTSLNTPDIDQGFYNLRRSSRVMFLAIKQGNYAKAISFLDYNPEDVNQWCDKEGRTGLIHCAFIKEEGKGVGLATALLQTGARVAHRDKHGLNTLHYACIHQRKQLVSVLLNSLDCHTNAKCKRTGNTALHFTAISGNADIAGQLIQQLQRYHLSLEVKNRNGMTPLQLAVSATSRVNSLRQERNRLKPSSAPLKLKQSKPKPKIELKLRPVIVKHVGFIDRTELSRLDSLRGMAMTGHRLARSADLVGSCTWSDTMPLLWTKYTLHFW